MKISVTLSNKRTLKWVSFLFINKSLINSSFKRCVLTKMIPTSICLIKMFNSMRIYIFLLFSIIFLELCHVEECNLRKLKT